VGLWTEAKEDYQCRKRHSEEQIVYALRQAGAGKKVGEICREMGISAQAFYRWKRRFAGLGLSELRELRQLEERERNTIERRIREAHLPRVKTLEEFDYTQSPHVTAAKMRDLAEGGYIERAEPVLFIGECDPGTLCTSLLHH
jgi:DNA replication protein DnaC